MIENVTIGLQWPFLTLGKDHKLIKNEKRGNISKNKKDVSIPIQTLHAKNQVPMPKTVTCKSAPETNRQGAIFLASVNSSFKSRSKKAVYLYKICFRIANHDASNFSMINFGEDDQTRMFDVFRPILPFFLPAIRDVQNYLRIFSRILTPCPPLYTFITF